MRPDPVRLPSTISFTVPGSPVPKARPRFVRRTGTTYTPARTQEAEQKIVAYLKAAYPHLRPSEAPFWLSLRFYLKGVGRGDWDNYGKLVSDALNGLVWLDDKQVRKADIELIENSQHPRIEIVAGELPALGRAS